MQADNRKDAAADWSHAKRAAMDAAVILEILGDRVTVGAIAASAQLAPEVAEAQLAALAAAGFLKLRHKNRSAGGYAVQWSRVSVQWATIREEFHDLLPFDGAGGCGCAACHGR